MVDPEGMDCHGTTGQESLFNDGGPPFVEFTSPRVEFRATSADGPDKERLSQLAQK